MEQRILRLNRLVWVFMGGAAASLMGAAATKSPWGVLPFLACGLAALVCLFTRDRLLGENPTVLTGPQPPGFFRDPRTVGPFSVWHGLALWAVVATWLVAHVVRHPETVCCFGFVAIPWSFVVLVVVPLLARGR